MKDALLEFSNRNDRHSVNLKLWIINMLSHWMYASDEGTSVTLASVFFCLLITFPCHCLSPNDYSYGEYSIAYPYSVERQRNHNTLKEEDIQINAMEMSTVQFVPFFGTETTLHSFIILLTYFFLCPSFKGLTLSTLTALTACMFMTFFLTFSKVGSYSSDSIARQKWFEIMLIAFGTSHVCVYN